jgi:hypothetical protein
MNRATCIVLAILTAPVLAQEKDTAKEKPLTPSGLVKTWQKKRQQIAFATQAGNTKAKEKAQKEIDDLVGKKVEGNAYVQTVGTEKDGKVSVQLGISSAGGSIVYLCQCAKDDFLSTLKKGTVVKVSGTVEEFKIANTKVVGKGAGARSVPEGPDTIVLKEAQVSKRKR